MRAAPVGSDPSPKEGHRRPQKWRQLLGNGGLKALHGSHKLHLPLSSLQCPSTEDVELVRFGVQRLALTAEYFGFESVLR
jgi:hypothetical protein